jgi:hypothetical protein
MSPAGEEQPASNGSSKLNKQAGKQARQGKAKRRCGEGGTRNEKTTLAAHEGLSSSSHVPCQFNQSNKRRREKTESLIKTVVEPDLQAERSWPGGSNMLCCQGQALLS